MTTSVLLIVVAGALVLYVVLVLVLVLLGRYTDARAVARFIPDCLILARRLLVDDRVPRRRKVLLSVLVAYLVMPLDLVPDFVPIAGQLDDAIIVALVLRSVLRSLSHEALRQHWPGPDSSWRVIARMAGT